MNNWNQLSKNNKKFVIYISVVLFILFSTVTFFFARTMYDAKISSEKKHSLRMDPKGVEPWKTPADKLPESSTYTNVSVGMYVDDIDTLSIKDSYFNVNAYIWFRWKGDKSLDPGGKFLLVDGKIDKKDLLDSYIDEDGTNYQKYRITARIIKFFDTSRTPIENHMLNIYVEDGARDGSKIRYVADNASDLSSRVSVPGFNITGTSSIVKNHTYKSSYGDPRLAENTRATFTQYIFAINIERSGFGLYFKILLGLFAACVLALASFFIKPSDVGPRFALPTGAYFGAVGNTYIANAILPSSGTFGVMDCIYGIGLIIITLSIVSSLFSHYLFVQRDEKILARVLDKTLFAVILISGLAANIIIPLCAFKQF